MQIVISVL